MSPLALNTLTKLKDAIARKGDLPSMSATLTKIVSSMRSEDENDERLVQAVLSDVALTQKVLRLANSSMYSAFGGTVTTVSKAIFILGTETVGHLALGLKLLDNFGQAADSETAQRELGMAVMSGVVARKLGSEVAGTGSEEVAVSALLRCTGRLLVCFYLPEDFKKLEEAHSSVDNEDEAATRLLGLRYGDIAQHMAQTWNLPEELSSLMSDSVQTEGDHRSWVQAVSGYSRRYVSAISCGADTATLNALAERYSEAVGRSASELVTAASEAFESSEEASAKQAVVRRANLKTVAPADSPQKQKARTTLQKLVAGFSEAQGLEKNLRPPQATAMAAEVLWDAFSCSRVMFFLRRPALKSYELMLGFGNDVHENVQKLRFEEAFSPNAFHVALSNATSVYLSDTEDPNIERRIPQWYKDKFAVAKSMLLVPVTVDKVSVGILYLDWGSEGRQQPLSPAELSYVDNFRSLVERTFIAARPKAASVPATARLKHVAA